MKQSKHRGSNADEQHTPADGTGSRIRELSAGSVALGAIIGFLIALIRPRSWR